MKRVCSWCNQEMSAGREAWPGGDHAVTHGICEKCAVGVLADLEAVEVVIRNASLGGNSSKGILPLGS